MVTGRTSRSVFRFHTDPDADADSNTYSDTEYRVGEQHARSASHSDHRQQWRCLDAKF